MANYTFDQLIDFTRTTSGTFVGSNGLIQTTPASVNLLLQTQQFDNASWTKTRSTVTANATVAPDGTSTADKLVEDTTASNNHYITQSSAFTTGITYTLSVYVKAAERNWFDIQIPATIMGTARNAYFDVSGGVVGTVSSGVTAAIASVGIGWYRCSVTFTPTASATTTNIFVLANADNSIIYTGDGTSGIFIWGAQLEVAATATTYTRNNGGKFPPRFDYDPVTLAPKGILIEEQRVNLLLRSEEFDSATWIKAEVTATANATTSPDGTSNAELLVPSVNAAAHQIYQSIALTNATAYTVTVYAKAGGYNFVNLRFGGGIASEAFFNLSNGTVVSATTLANASIRPAGNGWYRCSYTVTATSTTSFAVSINPCPTSSSYSVAGDGTSGVYAWGAQLEAGAFATSYIPTVASTVTRAIDNTTIVAPNFAPWYNQSKGTIVVEVSSIPAAGRAIYSVDNGTAGARILAQSQNAATDTAFRIVDTTDQANIIQVTGGAAGAIVKMASAYKVNDFATSNNGAAVGTDTSGTVPTGLNTLRIAQNVSNVAQLCGHVRSIRYYPVRFSDAQLQALTA